MGRGAKTWKLGPLDSVVRRESEARPGSGSSGELGLAWMTTCLRPEMDPAEKVPSQSSSKALGSWQSKQRPRIEGLSGCTAREAAGPARTRRRCWTVGRVHCV
jgi:hypothetical protein